MAQVTNTIKVSPELKARIDSVKEKLGLDSIEQVLALALNHIEKQAVKAVPETANERLLAIFLAIKTYNETQRKAVEPRFFPFPSGYFLLKEMNINRQRDTAGFLKANGHLIEKMHKECKISEGYKLHPALLETNSEGKNIFFANLCAQAGVYPNKKKQE